MNRLLIVALLLIAACSVPQPEIASVPGYDRSHFSGWVDTDGDCQDTRAEMLIAVSTTPATMRASGCTVGSGRWYDPYTGQTFTDASGVQIDHVVPLAWAWRHGASEWPEWKADRFALDPDNLLIVSSRANASKSDRGPDEWLLPNDEHQCAYVSRFAALAEEYGDLAP